MRDASFFALRSAPPGRTLQRVRLAGIDVRDAHALELALLLHHHGHGHTAERIETACTSYERDVALDATDKAAIVAVLDGPPADLIDLREALMYELRARWPAKVH